MSKSTLTTFSVQHSSVPSKCSTATLLEIESNITQTARQALQAYPHNAYTTLVTTRKSSAVPQFSFHCERLQNSALLINGASPPSIENALLKAMSTAVASVASDDEVQLVIVLIPSATEEATTQGETDLTCQVKDDTLNNTRWTLLVHASVIQVASTVDSIVVEARGAPRKQAFAKNTAWIEERHWLEAARGENITETILIGSSSDEDSALEDLVLLEGLVTNFYVIMRDGSLCTASLGDQILSGSIRHVVIQVARQRGMVVVERAPRISDRKNFAGAFITNAVHIITPIRCIRFPTLNEYEQVNFALSQQLSCLMDGLRNDVRKAVMNNSTDLEEPLKILGPRSSR